MVRRENGKIVIIFDPERWLKNPFVRVHARLIALKRNHEFSEEAKACGFKSLDEIWVLVLLHDWYQLLPDKDQLALKVLLERLLRNERELKRFVKGVWFFESFLKGRDLRGLDERMRWIIVKELKAAMEEV